MTIDYNTLTVDGRHVAELHRTELLHALADVLRHRCDHEEDVDYCYTRNQSMRDLLDSALWSLPHRIVDMA